MAVVAVDWGAKRVGVAVSESELIASPHSVIEYRGDLERLVDQIAAIGAQIEAGTFVVGLPERSIFDQRIRAFAEALGQKSCREVVLWNESYSTTEAASRRREAGKGRRSERNEIDMHAATVILQSYLDERRRRPL